MGVDISKFESHPNKPLLKHTNGVVEGVRRRTDSKLAEVAAIFHDLGKINPNFQLKLYKKKVAGYSSHAYLSALAWLCFCQANRDKLREFIGDDESLVFSVAAIIARHHGNLPNLEDGFFNRDEAQRMCNFLMETSQEALPFSDFLQHRLEHAAFSVFLPQQQLERLVHIYPCYFQHARKGIADPLSFYMNTQFGFASLIEADKRDVGNNSNYNKTDKGRDIKRDFALYLERKLQQLTPRSSLDELRTEMRGRAVEKLREGLEDGKRAFTLAAPTGAGKTLMLLRLASEILQHDRTSNHDASLGIIYALPFLSITEQTEATCREILHHDERAVTRVDSRSENKKIEYIQQKLEAQPNEEDLAELMREIFAEHTFDHPFIITTFVQLFETLVSNRNSTLLRLPNFARSIFLLDEIQALPPRLYTFFAAYLDEFCRKFDCYAVISTATMPYLEMKNKGEAIENPANLFKRYEKPFPLLGSDFFKHEEFDRYRITRLDNVCTLEELATEIRGQGKSCLVILNTVAETKRLHSILEDGSRYPAGEIALLNTHFTPQDRKRKITLCQNRLKRKKRVVLISTQLIEAGVDIDFPVLYRDMCPLPNLIQSAGRCNRNGREEYGDVYLFELKKENGRTSASYIYGRDLDWFLDFTKRKIKGVTTEFKMFDIQLEFFREVSENVQTGLHKRKGEDINMVKCINLAAFETLGKFRLIDDDVFGVEYRYYIREGRGDLKFDRLQSLAEKLKTAYRARDFKHIAGCKNRVEVHLRQMNNRVVTFRLPEGRQPPAEDGMETFGIYQLANPGDYSSVKGIRLEEPGDCII